MQYDHILCRLLHSGNQEHLSIPRLVVLYIESAIHACWLFCIFAFLRPCCHRLTVPNYGVARSLQDRFKNCLDFQPRIRERRLLRTVGLLTAGLQYQSDMRNHLLLVEPSLNCGLLADEGSSNPSRLDERQNKI